MNPHITIYRKWVPGWLKIPLLAIAMFPHLMLMSLFHSNISFSASFMEIEQEDIQFLLSLMYGTIVVTLLIFNRFLSYFRLRSYIILMSIVSIMILALMTVTNDFRMMMVLRGLSGIFGLLEGVCFLPLIIGQLKTKHSRSIAYLILYGFMLTGGTLTASLAKPAIADYGWSSMIEIFLLFHILVLFITVIIFTNERLLRKYPLFKIDYTSCLLLLIALHSAAFALIYYEKLDGFESDQIMVATILFSIFSGLFILRQYHAKRPIFNFETVRYKNVFTGMLLFAIFYFIRSGINNVYTIMATVWKWPWEYIIDIQYYSVAGTILGIITSGVLMIKEVRSTYIFGIGFFLLSIDCYWFSTLFYPDTTEISIGLPLVLYGYAQGWLFTPLVMYMITGLPGKLTGNASLMGTTVRFWLTNIGFAAIQSITHFLNTEHSLNLRQNLDSSSAPVQSTFSTMMLQYPMHDHQTSQSLSASAWNETIHQQALLLSNQEIFTGLFLFAMVTFILIFILKPVKIIINRFNF